MAPASRIDHGPERTVSQSGLGRLLPYDSPVKKLSTINDTVGKNLLPVGVTAHLERARQVAERVRHHNEVRRRFLQRRAQTAWPKRATTVHAPVLPSVPTSCDWDSWKGCLPEPLVSFSSHHLEMAPTWSTTAHALIAVAMVGAARTLVEPRVAASVRMNLLDAQRAKVDLFMHLHLSQDLSSDRNSITHMAAGSDLTATDSRLAASIYLLKPLNCTLHSRSDCSSMELSSHPVCRRLKAARENVSRVSISDEVTLASFMQYAWVARSLDAIMAHERARGARYKWVIRTRPDIAFFDAVPAALAQPPQRLLLMMKEPIPSYFDGVFYVPRGLLDDFTQGLHDFYAPFGIDRKLNEFPWPPEFAFFPWLRSEKGMPWSYFPVPAVLVRKAGRADCWRLRAAPGLGRMSGNTGNIYDTQLTVWGRDPKDAHKVLSFENACRHFMCACQGPESAFAHAN
mmetsp:Transcript_20859/g.40559  ORF Transcript_20859/g.40559 Transcript_20859/m.40559 type:complete len:456 (-) Transcript_20859:337-1704(-)